MSQNKLGLNITSAKNLYSECKLSVGRILKTSTNLEGKKLYEISSTKHVNSDSIINKIVTVDPKKYKAKTNCHKIINKNNNEKIWDDFIQLKEQSNIIQSITIRSSSKEISRWQRLVKNLPISSHNFCQKYLVSSLANRTNLKRWKISENSDCELRNCPETQLHTFNNCKLALDWYEWWHNLVISTICNHLKTKVTNDLLQLYADIDGYDSPATLFKRRYQAIKTNMDDNLRHRARPEKWQSNHCNRTYLPIWNQYKKITRIQKKIVRKPQKRAHHSKVKF